MAGGRAEDDPHPHRKTDVERQGDLLASMFHMRLQRPSRDPRLWAGGGCPGQGQGPRPALQRVLPPLPTPRGWEHPQTQVPVRVGLHTGTG